MKPAGDVFERNLRLLLRRSYVPALPAPHFRDRLESLFLAEAARGRNARRTRPVGREDHAWPRWAVAVAAGLLALFLGWRLFAPGAAPSRNDLLARGEVALSSADGSWRAAGGEERAHGVRFTPPRLVAVTPAGAELEILVASGRVHLGERSEVLFYEQQPRGTDAILGGGSAWFEIEGARVDLARGVAQPLRAPEPAPAAPIADAGRANTREERPTVPAAPAALPSPGSARVLLGRVVDAASGTPIASFEVGLLRERRTNETPPPVRRAFTSADGSFLWPDPPAGKQRVFVHAPGFALCALGELDLAGPIPELRAELEPGLSVRGSVLDTEGNPVPDALVLSERDVPSDGLLFEGAESYFWLPVQARSGPDGRFELAHLSRGAHVLRASARGHSPAWVEGVRLPGAAAEELVFRLGTGGTIEGRVTREDGGPRAGAVLVAVAMDESERLRQNFGFVLTDADGRYRFEHLPAITMVVVLVRADERPDARPVQVVEHQTVTADFAAARHGVVLHGRILYRDGRPVVDRNLGLFDAETASWGQDWIASTTRADGGYDFDGVPPGAYQLFLIDGKGNGLRCVDELVLAPDSHDVALDVEHDVRIPDGRMEVSVFAADTGEPAEGSALIVRRVEPDGRRTFSAYGSSDAQGRCIFVDQRPGDYVVTAYPMKAGLGFAQSEILHVEEDQPTPVELVHEAGGAVVVVARDAAGRSLEGASVVFHDEKGAEHLFSRMPLTDSAGRYRAQGVLPGRYRVQVELAGYRSSTVELRFELGREPEVPVVLTAIPPR